jgi:hypothetical protein
MTDGGFGGIGMAREFAATAGVSSDASSVEVIALCDIESPILQKIVTAWHNWRGPLAMPPRERLSLRELGSALKYVSLARVLDEGGDYEFRTIGDAHVQAYGTSYQNRRVSDVIAAAPAFGAQIRNCYELVRKTGRALAFRSEIGWDAPDSRFVLFETCYLPMGRECVDHIINAAVYAPQDRH